MASLFSCSGTPGKLISLPPQTVAPMSITIDAQYRMPQTGVVFDFVHLTTLGLCTNVDIQQSVAAQFQNTFDNTIYVTPFGDLPGTVTISFLINPSCSSTPGFSGSVINDYFVNRLQTSYYTAGPTLHRSPNIWLTIGALNPVSLYGYIIGLQLRGTSASSIMIEGVLTMKAWKYP